MSLLIEAIEEFVSQEHNVTKVITNLNNKYNLSAFDQKIIYNLFKLIRECISQYYTDVKIINLKIYVSINHFFYIIVTVLNNAELD